MGQNGVSHRVVADDLEGVKAVLAWLAYAPPEIGSAPLPLPTADPVGRSIGYTVPEGEPEPTVHPSPPGLAVVSSPRPLRQRQRKAEISVPACTSFKM